MYHFINDNFHTDIASVAVSVMTGVLVAGNLAPLQGYYAFAQETGVKTARYSAVKDMNITDGS